MFTIKHVKTDGNEEIHAGLLPSFVSKDSLEGRERGNSVIHYTDDKGAEQTIRWGKVYIMNESGRTVATYDLGQPLLNGQTRSIQGSVGFVDARNPPLSGYQNQASS